MSGLAPPLVAAGLGDLLWLILVILFIVVPAIGQLITKIRQQQKQQRGGGGRPPGQPPGGRRPGGLGNEVEEFLRRAAQRQQGGKPAAARPPAGQPVMAQAAPRPAPPRPPAIPVVEAQVVPLPALGEGVKRHVGEYLDAAEFQRRAGQLGEDVAQADEHVEQRLRAKFDREVSRLAGTPGESAAAPQPTEPEEPEDRISEIPSTAAAGLAVMLSNPQNIRQAIILNEILTRPEHRWA